MKLRVGVCSFVLLVGAIPAQASLVIDAPTVLRSPSVDDLSGATIAASPRGSNVVYSRTTQAGLRFNPGVGGNPVGTGLQTDITFDDIPIPLAVLGAGNTALEVTRVTVGIRRTGTDFVAPSGPQGAAPASDFNLFYTTATTTVVAPDTNIDTPPIFVATQSLPARTEAGFVTELVTFGDGVTPLFTVPLNFTILQSAPGAEDFGTFMIGLQISDTTGNALNGWRTTTGPSANAAGIFWLYDTDVANPEIAAGFGAAGPSSFFIEVEGTPIPEPSSLALLGVGCMVLFRRRR